MSLPDWMWRVIVETDERGELILLAHEPHRAAAKRFVRNQLEIPVQTWGETYILPETWDCPVCGTHEGATKAPNLRGDYDWECLSCGSKLWGEPMDWDRIQEGPHVPDYRKRGGSQQTLGDSE